MQIEVREEPTTALTDYATIPIVFEVRERFAVVGPQAGLEGVRLVVEPVAMPHLKDYDALAGESPATWRARFDGCSWTLLSARADGDRVGGAAVVRDGPDVLSWGGVDRNDVATLWDLRVAPRWRRRRVGAALFEAAVAWATSHGAAWLAVETQSTNVPACRFYARQGCVLGAVDRFAYPTLPDEVKLVWYRALGSNEADA